MLAVSDCASPFPVVLIDGRAGAGKTSLARKLRERWPLSDTAQLIALDALYPGWAGLAAGVETARRDILVPHAAGVAGRWREWDWELSTFTQTHQVRADRGLIVEGCGALTPQTAALADVRIWVQAPDDARKERALARDGDVFSPHWEQWAQQEHEHLRRNDPQALADQIVCLP